MENEREPIFKFWDSMNAAMSNISDAARVAISSEEVITHLKEYGCYEETYDPVFWVIDYIEKMFKE